MFLSVNMYLIQDFFGLWILKRYSIWCFLDYTVKKCCNLQRVKWDTWNNANKHIGGIYLHAIWKLSWMWRPWVHSFWCRGTPFLFFYCTLQIQTKLVASSILKHPEKHCELRQACLTRCYIYKWVATIAMMQ